MLLAYKTKYAAAFAKINLHELSFAGLTKIAEVLPEVANLSAYDDLEIPASLDELLPLASRIRKNCNRIS